MLLMTDTGGASALWPDQQSITFAQALESDAEALVALRTLAMRESLERIGRFDVVRVRERFLSGFEPATTRHILLNDERVGFLVVKNQIENLLLNHLYIRPDFQGRGIGAFALRDVCEQALRLQLPIHVGALRESASNRFYVRHGFQQVAEEEFDIYYQRDWQLPFA